MPKLTSLITQCKRERLAKAGICFDVDKFCLLPYFLKLKPQNVTSEMEMTAHYLLIFLHWLFFLILGLEKVHLTPSDIQYCVCTHGHSDHCGNMNLFTEALHILGFDICKGDNYILHDFKEVKSFTFLCFGIISFLLCLYKVQLLH